MEHICLSCPCTISPLPAALPHTHTPHHPHHDPITISAIQRSHHHHHRSHPPPSAVLGRWHPGPASLHREPRSQPVRGRPSHQPAFSIFTSIQVIVLSGSLVPLRT